MARVLLLDTDVLIDFLRRQPKALAYVDAHIDQILLSAIGVAELYSGVRGEAEQTLLDDFVHVGT